MRVITEKEYQGLRQQAKLLTADGHGDKVLELDSGKILKLFRHKRIISSAHYSPYTGRFIANAALLEQLGVSTVTEVEEFKIPSIERTAVCYMPLAGHTLREIQESKGVYSPELIRMFGAFVGRLHRQGVFFRSLHLGNVVLTPQHQLGLIDVADLHSYRRPLSVMLRLRNFKHTCRYQQDRQAMYGKQGFAIYWQAYREQANELGCYKQYWLRAGLIRKLKSYSD